MLLSLACNNSRGFRGFSVKPLARATGAPVLGTAGRIVWAQARANGGRVRIRGIKES